MERVELIMLGTGHATVTRCYNTCFVLKIRESAFMVDGGGGNGILHQLEKAGISLTDLSGIFITHVHIDHILGVVWVLRMIGEIFLDGNYIVKFNVYGHDKALEVLEWVCKNTLPLKIWDCIQKNIVFQEVKGDECIKVGMDLHLQCFDVKSCSEKQFGFHALLPNRKTLVCLGDAPYNEHLLPYVENADVLLCEAFCLDSDKEVYFPHEKNHSTVLEAAKVAEEFGVKQLILYHTEDILLRERKLRYIEEAHRVFSGQIYVPDDLERIVL